MPREGLGAGGDEGTAAEAKDALAVADFTEAGLLT